MASSPSTLGDDGDPLDVLLFVDAPLAPGSVATARVIGVMEVEQNARGKRRARNDRFLAVATHAHGHRHLRHIDDLETGLLVEIEAFFRHHADASGKKLRIVGHGGPREADRLLKKGGRRFKSSEA